MVAGEVVRSQMQKCYLLGGGLPHASSDLVGSKAVHLMDYESLSAMGVAIGWVGDRLRLQDIKPRHIGRVVTFDYALSDEDVRYVIGTLEGASGLVIIVSGDTYRYDLVQDLKVWRRAVKND